MPTNRYLEGNLAPVDVERTDVDLEVVGALPRELEGRYARSGPNPIDADPATYHWFLGTAMVHGVRLCEGRAEWYRNRWTTTSEIAARKGIAEVEGPSTGLEAGGNTNVIHHGGAIFAINELSMPYELTPELETVRRHDFGGPLPAGMNAHPKFDPVTGEMHVMAYHFVEPFLRYHVVDRGGTLVRTEEIAVGGPVMVHDMGLTESQLITFDLPVVFDMDRLAAGGLPYAWDDGYRARVGLTPRAGTGADTVWVDIDPCYVFHPLNAYDEGDGKVVVDVVRHSSMFKTDLHGPGGTSQSFDRWTIDPVAGKVLSERIDDRPQEFPRADERLATRRHRYGYTMGGMLEDLSSGAGTSNSIIKYDLVAGTSEVYSHGPGRTGGEFVFVPASGDAGEDEGWLVGYVHDASREASDLVVLDAHDFGTETARVLLPARVPAGFHGNWIPDRALA